MSMPFSITPTIRSAAVALSVFVSAPAMAATLYGDAVTIAYDFTVGARGPQDFTVGTGVELSCGYGGTGLCADFNFTALDIGENTISFKPYVSLPASYYNFPFNGWIFSGLDFGIGIGGVILSSTNMPGLDQSDVTFTANSIFINLAGASAGSGSWTLKLLEATSPSAVPLPASLPLGTLAIASLIALKRRRRT